MDIIFKDVALSELYESGKTKSQKYKKLCRNKRLVDGYQRVIHTMYDVDSTSELKCISFLHYEKLKYQGEQKSSVSLVNGRIERLLFTELENGIKVELLEIDSTHYGNKK